MQKIIQFEKKEDRYLRLADEYVESGDLQGALSFLFSALKLNRTAETLMDIADVYGQMGLYELSNRYWFYYMEKATKDKVSIAYEELAINFFYMDDFLTSSFYFHQKLTLDGFLSKEGLDKEIIEFFSGEEFKKNAYYIAYPFDKADYSFTAKRAKRALSAGNYVEAINLYKNIPLECLDEETAGDFSVSYLMNDDPDTAAAIARQSIAVHGDNMTAFCNLSNVYDYKEDHEKSEYYYQKALELKKGDKNEEYRLVTCAIERGDHDTVKECLNKILAERKYDTVMQFFLGLAKLNTGDYQGARKSLSAVYRLDPTDTVFKFYAQYAEKINNEGNKEYLPIKYVKSLPEKLVQEYEKKLEALSMATHKTGVSLKKQEYREVVEWGLYFSEDLARKSVYILGCDYTPYSKQLLKDYLMDSDGLTSIKQIIVYALTVNGCKERLSIVDRNFFFRIKAKKLSFEKQEQGDVYLCAYALAFSKMVFYGIEDLDSIAKTFNQVYAKLSKVLTKDDVTCDELAGLSVYLCQFARFQTPKEISRIFDIKKDKLSQLSAIVKGDKND